MALINCTECGKEISDQAEMCIHCGNPMKKKETMFCSKCGKAIDKDAIVCPHCGVATSNYHRQQQQAQTPVNVNVSNVNTNTNYNAGFVNYGRPRNKWVALALCFFIGFLGAHKFYEGKGGMGILYLFTLGIFGIGVFIDFILLLFKPNPYYV